MKYPLVAVSLAALAALAATTNATGARGARLRAYDYCAQSPLTIGSPFENAGRVADIHVIADATGAPVGWIYQSDRGRSFMQSNAKMSADDQSTLKLSAHNAVSNLRARSAALPPDLTIRSCRPSEIARF